MIAEDPVRVVAQARTHLNTRFKHQGRTPRGLDCAGLLVLTLTELGHSIVDRKSYGREPHKDGLRQTVQANMGQPLPAGAAMMPGDIVLMRFVREPHHLGILGDHPTAGLTLIHSFAEVGKVVEHRLDGRWASRILEVYRFAPIDGGTA